MRTFFLVLAFFAVYPAHAGLVCNVLPDIDFAPSEVQEAAKSTVVLRVVVISKEGIKTNITTPSKGSGFLVNTHGRIVTNSRIVEDHYRLEEDGHTRVRYEVVLSSCDIYTAKLIFTQRDGGYIPDIAFLDIIDPPKGLVPVEFETMLPVKDDNVYAIGAPGQKTNTIIQGVIIATAVEKIDNRGILYTDMIHASTPVIKGSSGGTLVNEDGKVLGMTTLCGTKSANNTSDGRPECTGNGYFISSDEIVRWLDFFQWVESLDSEE